MWQIQFSSAYSKGSSTEITLTEELENFLNIYSSHLCEEIITENDRYIYDEKIKYNWCKIRVFVIDKEFDENDELMLKLSSPQWRCEELVDLNDIKLPQYNISLKQLKTFAGLYHPNPEIADLQLLAGIKN